MFTLQMVTISNPMESGGKWEWQQVIFLQVCRMRARAKARELDPEKWNLLLSLGTYNISLWELEKIFTLTLHRFAFQQATLTPPVP